MATQNPSQNFVPIKDIKRDVVILKNGQMCKILLASSVNFALKSLDEQTAILSQFQNFLNTIDFSIQVYIQSRRLDIQPYLDILAARENQQDNDLMRIQVREYMEFIKTFTREVDIMSKNFFVVVPFTAAPVDLKQGFTKIFNQNKTNIKQTTETSFEEKRLQLNQRVSVVEQGLNRIGVRTVALEENALVELFYHIFNPGDPNRNAPERS